MRARVGFGLLLVAAVALCALTLPRVTAREADKDGGVEVTLQDLPAAVKATLQQAAGTGTIIEIEQGDHGAYSAEVVKDGRKCDVEIAADGKLIGIAADDESDNDGSGETRGSASAAAPAWTSEFGLDKDDLAPAGRNPYFVLEPGYQLVLKGGDAELIITVLNETKVIDGVETRVVEERETENGRLTEVSRNYFAISRKNNSVFYFGEDVDSYHANGSVSHGGGWHAGENGARAGLIMPGMPLLGARYYQEIAPKVAMDRCEVVSLTESVRFASGTFDRVLKTEETTPLEPGVKEYKLYAPGIGLIKDEDLELVRHGHVK
jgi:hypothetical protein